MRCKEKIREKKQFILRLATKDEWEIPTVEP